jgi:hypothetical protein
LRPIYKTVRGSLSNYENQLEIRKEFPKKSVERRNTGYAIDVLLESAPFTIGGDPFNFCKLIAGSEGTLAFITEIKLNVVPLPLPDAGLLCVHFNSIDEALRANLIALKYQPSASELIDHYILECTKDNVEQKQNRFFVQGDPGAILVIEFTRSSKQAVIEIAHRLKLKCVQITWDTTFRYCLERKQKRSGPCGRLAWVYSAIFRAMTRRYLSLKIQRSMWKTSLLIYATSMKY